MQYAFRTCVLADNQDTLGDEVDARAFRAARRRSAACARAQKAAAAAARKAQATLPGSSSSSSQARSTITCTRSRRSACELSERSAGSAEVAADERSCRRQADDHPRGQGQEDQEAPPLRHGYRRVTFLRRRRKSVYGTLRCAVQPAARLASARQVHRISAQRYGCGACRWH